MIFGSSAIQAQELNKNITTSPSITINNQTYYIEIANTPNKQRLGLMHRNYLAKNQGMLFTYNKPTKISIWMKNTYIPLDIIWINENKEITHIYKHAIPHSRKVLTTPIKSNYVLEINAGQSTLNNFKIGDKVKIKL